MVNSQNNATLVPENASFYFKQNVETQVSLLNASIMVFFYISFPFWCFLDEIWIFGTLFLEEMTSLHPLQNNFRSLTIKFSPGNSLTRSYNGLSLYCCFLSACNFHWLILKVDLELSVKGLVYVLRQNFFYELQVSRRWHGTGRRHLVCTSARTASES